MAGARSSSRRSLVARLFGPKNRRHREPAPKARLGLAVTRVLRVLPFVVLPLAAVAAWPTVHEAIRRHPYFAVREITAPSHGRIAPDVLRATAAIPLGASIWDVDEIAAAERLRSLQWVRSARVRRHLPNRVVLDVREYRPMAILRVDEGAKQRLFYVARSGRPFAPVGPQDAHDLPYITGVAAADLDGAAYGVRAVRSALAVLRKAGHRVSLLGDLSEVHVDRASGLTLMPVRPAVPIALGWDGFDTKLERLRYVLAQWIGREQEMVAVSCVFDDDVIVRVDAPATATPAPRAPAPKQPPAKRTRRTTGA